MLPDGAGSPSRPAWRGASYNALMLLRALRQIRAPALATAAYVLHERRCSAQCEPAAPIQRLFSWGLMRPSETEQFTYCKELPSETTFWASKGLCVVSMSYGSHHAAALDDRGGLWAWGGMAGPTPRQLPCRAKVTGLASTDASLYAVTKQGKVLEWRDLGSTLSADKPPPAEPAPLGGALAKVAATSVAAGAAHVLVVGRKGELVGLGENNRGQLGLGPPEEAPRFEAPTMLPPVGGPVTTAACGGEHSVAILADGSCVSFGDDRHLQLGLRGQSIKELRRGDSTVHEPRPVAQLAGKVVTAVAAGGRGLDGGHTAFTVSGEGGDELWMCGHGRWGQLGLKAFTHVSEPQAVKKLGELREYDEKANRVQTIKIAQVVCGERHTAAVLATGNVFVWGWNDKGQLGTTSKQGTHTPTMLKEPAELRFSPLRHVACGPYSTAAWS